MKKLIILIQITTLIILTGCIWFMLPNYNIEVTLLNPAITLPLWILKGGSFAVGILTGTAICGIYLSKGAEKYLALERRNEKKEINADNSQAKIKVLENKIASLETALEKALKKNS